MQKWILTVILLASLILGVLGHWDLVIPEARAAWEWEKIGDAEELTLYKHDVPGTAIVALRGAGEIHAPMTKVLSVLLDVERSIEWVDRLALRKILKMESPTQYIEYSHIETPFVLKDRDFLGRIRITLDPNDKSVEIQGYPIEDSIMPHTKYIRGDASSIFRLTPTKGGTETHMDAELQADPKGTVPKWIVNLFQKAWPEAAFKGIRKQCKKTDIRVPPEFQLLLEKVRKYSEGFEGLP